MQHKFTIVTIEVSGNGRKSQNKNRRKKREKVENSDFVPRVVILTNDTKRNYPSIRKKRKEGRRKYLQFALNTKYRCIYFDYFISYISNNSNNVMNRRTKVSSSSTSFIEKEEREEH